MKLKLLPTCMIALGLFTQTPLYAAGGGKASPGTPRESLDQRFNSLHGFNGFNGSYIDNNNLSLTQRGKIRRSSDYMSPSEIRRNYSMGDSIKMSNNGLTQGSLAGGGVSPSEIRRKYSMGDSIIISGDGSIKGHVGSGQVNESFVVNQRVSSVQAFIQNRNEINLLESNQSKNLADYSDAVLDDLGKKLDISNAKLDEILANLNKPWSFSDALIEGVKFQIVNATLNAGTTFMFNGISKIPGVGDAIEQVNKGFNMVLTWCWIDSSCDQPDPVITGITMILEAVAELKVDIKNLSEQSRLQYEVLNKNIGILIDNLGRMMGIQAEGKKNKISYKLEEIMDPSIQTSAVSIITYPVLAESKEQYINEEDYDKYTASIAATFYSNPLYNYLTGSDLNNLIKEINQSDKYYFSGYYFWHEPTGKDNDGRTVKKNTLVDSANILNAFAMQVNEKSLTSTSMKYDFYGQLSTYLNLEALSKGNNGYKFDLNKKTYVFKNDASNSAIDISYNYPNLLASSIQKLYLLAAQHINQVFSYNKMYFYTVGNYLAKSGITNANYTSLYYDKITPLDPDMIEKLTKRIEVKFSAESATLPDQVSPYVYSKYESLSNSFSVPAIPNLYTQKYFSWDIAPYTGYIPEKDDIIQDKRYVTLKLDFNLTDEKEKKDAGDAWAALNVMQKISPLPLYATSWSTKALDGKSIITEKTFFYNFLTKNLKDLPKDFQNKYYSLSVIEQAIIQTAIYYLIDEQQLETIHSKDQVLSNTIKSFQQEINNKFIKNNPYFFGNSITLAKNSNGDEHSYSLVIHFRIGNTEIGSQSYWDKIVNQNIAILKYNGTVPLSLEKYSPNNILKYGHLMVSGDWTEYCHFKGIESKSVNGITAEMLNKNLRINLHDEKIPYQNLEYNFMCVTDSSAKLLPAYSVESEIGMGPKSISLTKCLNKDFSISESDLKKVAIHYSPENGELNCSLSTTQIISKTGAPSEILLDSAIYEPSDSNDVYILESDNHKFALLLTKENQSLVVRNLETKEDVFEFFYPSPSEFGVVVKDTGRGDDAIIRNITTIQISPGNIQLSDQGGNILWNIPNYLSAKFNNLNYAYSAVPESLKLYNNGALAVHYGDRTGQSVWLNSNHNVKYSINKEGGEPLTDLELGSNEHFVVLDDPLVNRNGEPVSDRGMLDLTVLPDGNVVLLSCYTSAPFCPPLNSPQRWVSNTATGNVYPVLFFRHGSLYMWQNYAFHTTFSDAGATYITLRDSYGGHGGNEVVLTDSNGKTIWQSSPELK